MIARMREHRGELLALVAALSLSACSPHDPSFSATDSRLGLEIRTAHGSRDEVQKARQLAGVLAVHDLSAWIFTRSVVIDKDAVSHSHPVLTLGARHLGDDGLLLSEFVHEQIHWYLVSKEQQTEEAVAELAALLPGAPVNEPEGAGSAQSTYLHLVVGWLEWDAMARLVGEAEALRVIQFWSGDHYRWDYRTLLSQRALIGGIVIRHGLLV